MKQPNTWTIASLAQHLLNNHVATQVLPGKWDPARPMAWGGFFARVKAAYLVFTGKADAVVWPGQ